MEAMAKSIACRRRDVGLEDRKPMAYQVARNWGVRVEGQVVHFSAQEGTCLQSLNPKKFHTLRYIQCQQIQQLTQTEQKGEPGHVWDSLGKQGKPRSDKLLHSENRNSLER